MEGPSHAAQRARREVRDRTVRSASDAGRSAAGEYAAMGDPAQGRGRGGRSRRPVVDGGCLRALLPESLRVPQLAVVARSLWTPGPSNDPQARAPVDHSGVRPGLAGRAMPGDRCCHFRQRPMRHFAAPLIGCVAAVGRLSLGRVHELILLTPSRRFSGRASLCEEPGRDRPLHSRARNWIENQEDSRSRAWKAMR